jgi:hypothetical protein
MEGDPVKLRQYFVVSRLRGWGKQGVNRNRGKKFICSPKLPDRLSGPSNRLFNIYWGTFSREGIRSGPETDNSSLCCADIKNEQSHTAPLPVLIFMVYKDNVTFIVITETQIFGDSVWIF